jgi:hypothetical protein
MKYRATSVSYDMIKCQAKKGKYNGPSDNFLHLHIIYMAMGKPSSTKHLQRTGDMPDIVMQMS